MSKAKGVREIACFVPDLPQGSGRVQDNDVTVDDRVRGLHIPERT